LKANFEETGETYSVKLYESPSRKAADITQNYVQKESGPKAPTETFSF
jgi:hypothetical protein